MPPKHPTDYQGLPVNGKTKRELEASPIGEFLNITGIDGKYVAQARLPEMGAANGKEFHIRTNMNRFLKGMAETFVRDDGTLDLPAMENFYFGMSSDADTPEERGQQLAEAFEIPEGEEREDFIRFFAACEPGLSQIAFFVSGAECTNLKTFQYNLEHVNDEEDPKLQETRQRLVGESLQDYQNRLTLYAEMKDLNVDGEKRFLLPLDCEKSAAINELFLKHNTEYRKNKGLPILNPLKKPDDPTRDGPLKIEFPQKDIPSENKYLAFDTHHVFRANVLLDGQARTVSLETTAPPTGKLLFSPGVQTAGVGLFESEKDLIDYHTEKNLLTIEDHKNFLLCKVPNPTKLDTVRTTPSPKDLTTPPVKPTKAFFLFRPFEKLIHHFQRDHIPYAERMETYRQKLALYQNGQRALGAAAAAGGPEAIQPQAEQKPASGLTERQQKRLEKQLDQMKRSVIYEVGRRAADTGFGISDVRYSSRKAYFVRQIENLAKNGAPETQKLIGKLADSKPDSMNALFETWSRSGEAKEMDRHFIDRAANTISQTIPLKSYLGKELNQTFAEANGKKEADYGKAEFEAFEKFADKSQDEYDMMTDKEMRNFNRHELANSLNGIGRRLYAPAAGSRSSDEPSLEEMILKLI